MQELVKLHGGRMLKSFDQGKYMKKKEFPKQLAEGVCAALSTVWISRRAKVRISSNTWTPTRRAPK
jgi:hypothetical protein